MNNESKFQIGKNRITKGAIDSLNLSLKTHNQIRISVLKSAERDRNKIILMADEIIQKINCKCKYKIIGFTIVLKRQSSKQKSKKKSL